MLSINLYGSVVGYLNISNSSVQFEYEHDFQKKGLEVSPFLMPSSSRGIITRPSRDLFRGLPEFIFDALPEIFGSMVMESYFAKLGREGIAGNDVLSRLSFLGKSAIGALEFQPCVSFQSPEPTLYRIEELVNSVNSLVDGNLVQISNEFFHMASSAGGACPKALIAARDNFETIIGGYHRIPKDFEHYLIKFDGMNSTGSATVQGSSTNIEYAYYLMARVAGIEIMDSYLLDDDVRQHFVTKRFDRIGDEKIHAQSLCALTGLDFNLFQSASYSDYFAAVVNLGLSFAQQKEAFRRMVFNILTLNRDDHTKNFSFMLSRSGYWSLAPAYDLNYAYSEHSSDVRMREHSLLINGKGTDISLQDMLIESSILSLSTRQKNEIVEQAIDSVSRWTEFAVQANVQINKRRLIQRHIQQAINALKLSEVKKFN